ncbi:MAG: amidohydrolase [Proteobacteria bacterium]|nr:amidohydrolase [Burkholderiales bacterium]
MSRHPTTDPAWVVALAALLLSFSVVAAPAHAAAATDAQKMFAWAAIDRNAEAIATLSDNIYYFAELGMQEHESAKLLVETLRAIGFRVRTGDAGFPTNVWAEWGSGLPRIAIVTEIDALPEGSQTPGSIERKPLIAGAPGHMEGHNTHAGVTVGAAHALKLVMERDKLPGTIVLSYGPAEEQLVSRPFLVRAGLFKDIDAAMLIHIGATFGTGVGLMNYGAVSAEFTFRGKTAHGAQAPWDGRDAVDAVVLMDTGVNALREHLRPTARAHRTITHGGIQPNIIADLGKIWWYVRDDTGPKAMENFSKVVKVAEGAALMTSTTLTHEVIASAWPQLSNRAIAEAIQKNIENVGLPAWTSEELDFARRFQKSVGVPEMGLATRAVPFGTRPQSFASNDNGDVTWVVPSGYFQFPASVPGISYHNWVAGVTPTMSISHKGQVAGAKVLAATMLDLLTDADLLARAKAQFAQDTKTTKYVPMLPPTAKPPLDLNREMMEKYRPEMRKFYIERKPVFK